MFTVTELPEATRMFTSGSLNVQSSLVASITSTPLPWLAVNTNLLFSSAQPASTDTIGVAERLVALIE